MAQCTLAFCAGVKAEVIHPESTEKLGVAEHTWDPRVEGVAGYSQLASSRPVQSIGQL